MYLHAGNGVIIESEKILGIFDLDSSTESEVTADFIRAKERNKKTVNCKKTALPKSYILTDDGTVYISEIAPDKLVGRSENKSIGTGKSPADLKRII